VPFAPPLVPSGAETGQLKGPDCYRAQGTRVGASGLLPAGNRSPRTEPGQLPTARRPPLRTSLPVLLCPWGAGPIGHEFPSGFASLPVPAGVPLPAPRRATCPRAGYRLGQFRRASRWHSGHVPRAVRSVVGSPRGIRFRPIGSGSPTPHALRAVLRFAPCAMSRRGHGVRGSSCRAPKIIRPGAGPRVPPCRMIFSACQFVQPEEIPACRPNTVVATFPANPPWNRAAVDGKDRPIPRPPGDLFALNGSVLGSGFGEACESLPGGLRSPTRAWMQLCCTTGRAHCCRTLHSFILGHNPRPIPRITAQN